MARSWQASQHQCSQAGDHLLSTIPQSDIWTWGNICPDSPGKHPVNTLPANISLSFSAPLHSMWTDNSEKLETNSELCEGRGPDWRGAPCQSFLYGVCQSQVSPAPSPPLTLPSPHQLSPDVTCEVLRVRGGGDHAGQGGGSPPTTPRTTASTTPALSSSSAALFRSPSTITASTSTPPSQHERMVFKLPESVRGNYMGQSKVLVE